MRLKMLVKLYEANNTSIGKLTAIASSRQRWQQHNNNWRSLHKVYSETPKIVVAYLSDRFKFSWMTKFQNTGIITPANRTNNRLTRTVLCHLLACKHWQKTLYLRKLMLLSQKATTKKRASFHKLINQANFQYHKPPVLCTHTSPRSTLIR